VYETTAGERLEEGFRINGYVAFRNNLTSDLARGPRTDAIMVRPGAAKIDVAGSFSHVEIRAVNESYVTREPRTTTEVVGCPTCIRSVTEYRPETRYQLVNRLVDVVDAWCSQTLFVAPAVGGVYWVDFTYRNDRLCSAVCVEKLAGRAEGSIETRPCPAPNEAEVRELSRDD
jgi:hypothetical protein